MNRGAKINVCDKFAALVLIPRRLQITDAARMLRVRCETLSRALKGRQYLTEELLRRMRIVFGIAPSALVPSDLLERVPTGRALVRAEHLCRFKPHPKVRRNRRGKCGGESTPGEAFGHLLGLAIATERMPLKGAAHLLGTSKGELSSIIAGRRRITQQFLRRHQVLARLMKAFPIGWSEYGDELQRCASQVPARHSKSRVRSMLIASQ